MNEFHFGRSDPLNLGFKPTYNLIRVILAMREVCHIARTHRRIEGIFMLYSSSNPLAEETLPPLGSIPVRVRSLRVRDWRTLTRLLQQAFPTLDASRIAHGLRNEPHRYVVAVTSEGVSGVARLTIHPGERCTDIDLLAVDESARGRGVATALLRHVGEVAHACGAPRLTARLEADNLPALALLTGRGFEPMATVTSVPKVFSWRGRQPSEVETTRVTGSKEPLLTLSCMAPSPVWTDWRLQREHAPRVPLGLVERTARLALYGAWVGARS